MDAGTFGCQLAKLTEMFSISSSNPARVRKARTLFLVTLLAASVPAAALAKNDKDKPVKYEPFTAGAQFSEALGPSTKPDCQPTQSQPGMTMEGTLKGIGLATAVGGFTVLSTDCVRSTNPYGFTPPFAFNSSAFVLSTADGERIVISYQGTAEPTPSGLFTLNGTFNFVSGTGKFKNVQGGGTISGVENIGIIPAQGFVTLTGQIAY